MVDQCLTKDRYRKLCFAVTSFKVKFLLFTYCQTKKEYFNNAVLQRYYSMVAIERVFKNGFLWEQV